MSAYKKRLQSRRKLKPASVMLHHAAKMSSKGISLGWHKMVTFAKTPSVKQHDCRGREKVLNLKGRRGSVWSFRSNGYKIMLGLWRRANITNFRHFVSLWNALYSNNSVYVPEETHVVFRFCKEKVLLS